MISLLPSALSDQKIALLRSWLNESGCIEFQRLIANLAAASTAQAGVLAVRGEDQDKIDISEHIQKAKDYDAVNKVIDQMRAEEYNFTQYELKPEIKNQD